MTKEELISHYCDYRGKCTTDDVAALTFAYRMLAPRWISVEDALPEMGEDALHDDNPIIRTEQYCKYFRHVRAQYWCDKGVFPVDCKNCDKADWIEYKVMTTTATSWKEKGDK